MISKAQNIDGYFITVAGINPGTRKKIVDDAFPSAGRLRQEIRENRQACAAGQGIATFCMQRGACACAAMGQKDCSARFFMVLNVKGPGQRSIRPRL